ncbi:MAG TPA: glycosyltransferase family 1 protein [Candidatus Saccharimonadales bacterium]|nr:glycosyltransferase family 1 protein [Candidatus Saccharimonadales bacterium]
MKNIIFDGQVLQTDAWYRGMGRYTLQLLHSLSDMPSQDIKLHIIFNKNINCAPERFEVIKYLCPNVEQIIADLPVATDRSASERAYKRKLTSLLKKSISGSDNYFVITSLFSFSFFAQFPNNCRKILLFYDLTPLLFWKDLGGYFPPHLYMKRFRQVYEADIITTISGTILKDVISVFGFEPNRVVNINGGFTKSTNKAIKPKRIGRTKKYLLFVSGDLPHKNNEFAVKGFAKYKKLSGSNVDLVISSTFSEQSQQELMKIYPDVIFSGNVSDEELEWLYEHAQAVLFASKYEGLGIPILDAVFNNKPVIASSIPVFKEMTDKFYFFNPNREDELVSAIHNGLAKKDFAERQKDYSAILNKYSWQNTANEFIGAIKSAPENLIVKKPAEKIALVSVHPGISGQVGRLAEPLNYWLSKDFIVDYYFDSTGLSITKMERPTFLDQLNVRVADITEMTPRAYRSYTEVIFLLDNKSLRYKTAEFAAVLPGICVADFRGVSRSSKLAVRDVVLDNQKSTLNPEDKKPEQIAQWIKEQIKDVKPSKSELIIRQRAPNSIIMRKLLKVNV